MQNKSYIKQIRTAKLIQLIITISISAIFFILLFSNSLLRNNIFSNVTLTFLCFFFWFILLCSFTFLLVDFLLLRKLALESHHLNQLAYLDDLTNIPNRTSLDLLSKTYNTPESLTDIGCCMLSISNLSEINETIDRESGDILLRDFCRIFEEVGDAYGFVGRNSGNEFILIIEHCFEEKCQNFIDELNQRLDVYNNINPNLPIKIKVSTILNSQAKIKRLDKLLAATSKMFYHDPS